MCDAISEVNAELGLGHTEKLLYIERVRKHEDVVVLSERIWLPERLFKNLEEIQSLSLVTYFILLLSALWPIYFFCNRTVNF